MGKMEQNREKKRQAIIGSAKSLFLEQGYTATSMDNVAAAAKMTKQTLYRYYESKEVLFSATLKQMGIDGQADFTKHLQNEDSGLALLNFSTDFLRFHLSEEHLATYRLLVSESQQAPEIVQKFFQQGEHEINASLEQFLTQRLNISAAVVPSALSILMGMLLAPRHGVLLGLTTMTDKEITLHASNATQVFLKSFT
ncbi:TetR/AcrR family transcriptional regulator [Vibrio maerlii]|uniref:TetR/AcrR family transcriptional regulator n=1 Tax=Vibrio maerlii TaxID=2231648 RepID=UPI000E3DAB9C|nr:TetR/AcrR family transcriptional regulator [Vibrio maerlii]